MYVIYSDSGNGLGGKMLGMMPHVGVRFLLVLKLHNVWYNISSFYTVHGTGFSHLEDRHRLSDLCRVPHVQHLRRPMLRSCWSTAMELTANQSQTVSQS